MDEIVEFVYAYPFWTLFGLLFLYYFFSFAWSPRKDFKHVSRKLHHTFDGVKFSGDKIYSGIEAAIKIRKIDGVSFNRVTYKSVSVFSENREYLQIHRGHQVALICAAPFATGYFISYWLGEPANFLYELLIRLPFLGPRIEKALASQTFYQMDTDTIFLETVKHCVLEAVDNLANEKGVRTLSEELRLSGAIQDASNA